MKEENLRKYIAVTGGVLSGLGKGIAAASIGFLLSKNLKVIPIKCDGYLNTDPGTMNPIEHGEVFVLDDGGEVDMDFGHYERFLNIEAKLDWNITMGKIFQSILVKEREGVFLGKTVQFIPHVVDEIKDKIRTIVRKENPEIVLIEVGGTVGDMENELFLEALRQMRLEEGKNNFLFIHLTYIPVPSGVNEQKSKPTQQSVKLLNERGIHPDIIIGRCESPLSMDIKRKIAMFCNINEKEVISGIDTNCIYEIPLNFDKDGITAIINKRFNIYCPPKLDEWELLVKNLKQTIIRPKKTIKLSICGKYTKLEDSYASIREAVIHCEAHLGVKVEIDWVDTTKIEKEKIKIEDSFKNTDAIIIPGGFGFRGMEGKIKVVEYARKNKIPFLGICLGLQIAVIEFARNRCNIHDATTEEEPIDNKNNKAGNFVICLLPEQKKIKDKGATMRLGGYDINIIKDTLAHRVFEKDMIRRRFRHRLEVNPEYHDILKKNGLVLSGWDEEMRIVKVIEIKDHPFFIASQFHPELTSKLYSPSPLFLRLIKAAMDNKYKGDEE